MLRLMRRGFAPGLALVLGSLAPGCANTTPAPTRVAEPDPNIGAAPPAAIDAIGRVLDDWHRAAAEADEARYFSHFAPGAIFLGTDRTEHWDLDAFRAFARPYFAKGKAWSFTAVRRSVTVAATGAIAWFDEDLDTPNMGPARGSGVLLLGAGGVWKIVHYNLAITVPNDRMDAVKSLIAGQATDPSPR